MALAPCSQNFHQAEKGWYRVDIKGSSELRPKVYNTLPVYMFCLICPTPDLHICLHGWAVNVMESKWHLNHYQVSVTLSNAFSSVFRSHSFVWLLCEPMLEQSYQPCSCFFTFYRWGYWAPKSDIISLKCREMRGSNPVFHFQCCPLDLIVY